MIKHIDKDTLEVLARMPVEGNILRMPVAERLERDAYLRLNAVLTALGGHWSKGVKGHVFQDDPTERVADALATGTVERLPSPDAMLGFFPTPDHLAVGSAGVKFRTDRATVALRESIARLGGRIEDLPDDTFKPVGTNVRTVLVEVG